MEDPDIHPASYEPPRRSSNGAGSGDLIVAAEKARQHPGHWVNVGQPRVLTKPPHNWVSEVRLGQKKELRGPGEKWDAAFDITGGQDDDKMCQKMIRLVIIATPAGPSA